MATLFWMALLRGHRDPSETRADFWILCVWPWHKRFGQTPRCNASSCQVWQTFFFDGHCKTLVVKLMIYLGPPNRLCPTALLLSFFCDCVCALGMRLWWVLRSGRFLLGCIHFLSWMVREVIMDGISHLWLPPPPPAR